MFPGVNVRRSAYVKSGGSLRVFGGIGVDFEAGVKLLICWQERNTSLFFCAEVGSTPAAGAVLAHVAATQSSGGGRRMKKCARTWS